MVTYVQLKSRIDKAAKKYSCKKSRINFRQIIEPKQQLTKCFEILLTWADVKELIKFLSFFFF